MAEKVALILDGGFVTKALRRRTKTPVTATTISKLVAALLAYPEVSAYKLHRCFYYDCPPLTGRLSNPISKSPINFSTHPKALQQRQFLADIELLPNFAVRRGSLLCHGWRLKKKAVQALAKGPLTIGANHIEPHLQQKGVDQKITLDLVSMAEKRLISAAVVVICDSDFVPVLKEIRREGVRVILFAFAHGIKPELKVHSDLVIPDSAITI